MPTQPARAVPTEASGMQPADVVGVDAARKVLPGLVKSAETGTNTTIARGDERAVLTALSPQDAARYDLADTPVFGIADARAKLGDLVLAAAAGTPQVLRRHSHRVAVLLPPSAFLGSIASAHPDAPAPREEPAVEPSPESGTETQASAAPRRRLADLGQALQAVLAPAITAADATSASTGLPTGITALDQALGGLQPGRLYLVAGAPGAGASLIAAGAARTAALDEHRPVLYAASGLTRTDVAMRIIAAHTPVDYRRLRAGALTDDERGKVAATTALLTGAPLHIDDGSGLDAEAIADTVPYIDGLALVVVDRLQAVSDPRLPLSGAEAVADAVQALAHLARTRHLAVLAALDTADTALTQALGADVTLTLTRDGDRAHLAITERDLGTLATVHVWADLTHARITDPDADPAPSDEPSASRPAAPDVRVPAATRPSTSGAGTSGAGTSHHDYSYFLGLIDTAVKQALDDAAGDVEAATAALVKKAIPNGMELFNATRVGGTYAHTIFPDTLDLLRKKTQKGTDEVWEGRHQWRNIPLHEAARKGTVPPAEVTVLDTNAAYLAAFKCHLPIGALSHDSGGGFDRKKSGIYLLATRPAWDHDELPDPIGNRRESGPVLIDDATLRLLIGCAELGLCEAPRIAESWTSGATEGLLEKFRRVLVQARKTAIETGDAVTEAYVKAMYSKFTSTIGESAANRDLRRPDWMHIIRSQAYANLWRKAYKAHQAGLTIVQLSGTDELHVAGDRDWRTVFSEGRMMDQMKVKTTRMLGKAG